MNMSEGVYDVGLETRWPVQKHTPGFGTLGAVSICSSSEEEKSLQDKTSNMPATIPVALILLFGKKVFMCYGYNKEVTM